MKVNEIPFMLLVEALQAAGPTATKLVQWIGTRADLFPKSLLKYAVRLQSQVPSLPFPFVWNEICHTSQNQSKYSVYVDAITIGCGSVAQAYRILLRRNSSTWRFFLSETNKLSNHLFYRFAVMKVIKPNAPNLINRDLALLKKFTDILSRLWGYKPSAAGSSGNDEVQWFPLNLIVKSFSEFLLPQTNMLIEAKNLKVFRSNFRKIRSIMLLRLAGGRVIVPRVIDSLTSCNVLTESLEAGITMDRWLLAHEHVKSLKEEQVSRKIFANFGCQMFLQMLLLDNFIHCDLHPGNILVRLRRKDSRMSIVGGQHLLAKIWMTLRPSFDVVILDCGLVSRLTPNDRVNFIHLFKALTFGEGYQAGRLLVERARKQDCRDVHAFCSKVAQIVESFVGPPIQMRDWLIGRQKYLTGKDLGGTRNTVKMTLNDMKVGEAMREIASLCVKHRVQLEPAFLGIILAMGVVEGLGIQLDPNLDLISASRPYLGLIARETLLKYEHVWWNNSSVYNKHTRVRRWPTSPFSMFKNRF